jgi:four helix bundle protein
VEEAGAGQTRKDFLAKMAIASKEARETKYWLRLLQESELVDVDVTDELNAIDEIIRILTAIVKTTSAGT